jgi:hypothetical protein
MKVITNPISNIPKLANSHVRGWSQVWAEQLGAEIDHRCSPAILNAETVYIEHGVNFGGTLNLFGGATEEIYDRINTIMSCDSNIVSLDHDMPNWGEQLRSRIGAPTTYKAIDEAWCDKLSKWCKSISTFRQEDMFWLDGVSVGDSHTPAFSRKRDVVLRENGKTLFGCLRRGLKGELRSMTTMNEITFSLGSIDIRHHLLRYEDNLEEMIKEYVRQGKEIEMEYAAEVTYAAPVPVEHEGRKLPKTGYFKGTPFFGSREDRLALTFRFIDLLKKHSGNKVVMPPEEWYHMDGEKYAKTYMENSSSVHISPEYYRRYGWGRQDNSLENFFT